MVIRRLGEIGNVRIKIVHKEEKGTVGRPPQPSENFLVHLLRILAFKRIKPAETLIKRLYQRGSQQSTGQIVAE